MLVARPPLTVWTATICPFTRSGDLDEDGYRRHLRRLAKAGVNVLIASEGTGEAQTLDWPELRRCLEIGKEELTGKVPGWGMGRKVHRASEMVAFVHLVQDLGLDGVHIHALEMAQGNVPSEREQEAYLTEVFESVHIPAILSLHASAGYRYPIKLIRQLAERYPNLVGCLVVTSDLHYQRDLFDALGSRLQFICAYGNLLPALASGFGSGFCGQEGNLAPELCQSFVEYWQAHRYDDALAAYDKILQMGKIVHSYGFAVGIKAALNLLGLPGGYPRRPRLPLPDEAVREIAESLEKLNIPELAAYRASLSGRRGPQSE